MSNTELSTLPHTTKSQARPIPDSWTEKLFEKLAAYYGKKFTDMWAGLDQKTLRGVWAEELSGYTGEEIRNGLQNCKKREWPPTLPEFLMLCRPPMPPEVAYSACQRAVIARGRGECGQWPSKAAYHAYKRFGHYDFVNSNWATAKNLWVDLLAKAQIEENAGTLDDIPPPLVLLPEPVTPKADAQKKIREILQTVVKKIEDLK